LAENDGMTSVEMASAVVDTVVVVVPGEVPATIDVDAGTAPEGVVVDAGVIPPEAEVVAPEAEGPEVDKGMRGLVGPVDMVKEKTFYVVKKRYEVNVCE
jgi:hypothetical protein